MTINILSFIVAGATMILTVGNANAQLTMKGSDATAGISAPKADDLKKSSPAVAISYRTLKNFKKQFTNTDAAWYEIDDAYIAKFSDNSAETMVGYGKRGTWLYTIKRYGEKSLPKEVRAQVKSIYYDYTISHIDEVHLPKQESSIYIIQLRDNNNFKTLSVCDREMEVIREYHN